MNIGIVNDMPLAAEALRRAVMLDPRHRVSWIAGDGVEAVAKCLQDRPDLVLMDLMMPRMGGVQATRQIMAQAPCPILIVTASVAGNSTLVYAAMAEGALDAVQTPELAGGDLREKASTLLRKIEQIEREVQPGDFESRPVVAFPRPASRQGTGLVAIGASAGGPAALATVLTGLPRAFPAAVVVVQHVDEKFAQGMADWLAVRSTLPLRLAAEGDRLEAGVVLLAGAHGHLVLKDEGSVGYTSEPADCVYVPSVDVFFASVCRHWRRRAVGVQLTGMGSDGAKGLKAMRDKGWTTIAQDQSTSVVYGMPKAAAALGAAVHILPIQDVAPRLVQSFAGPRGQGERHDAR